MLMRQQPHRHYPRLLDEVYVCVETISSSRPEMSMMNTAAGLERRMTQGARAHSRRPALNMRFVRRPRLLHLAVSNAFHGGRVNK